MLTYGALCELAARHGVTITENVRAFVREVEEEDRRAIGGAQPVAYQYLYSWHDGSDVWRDDARSWNGQTPKASRALYTRPAEESAQVAAFRKVVRNLEQAHTGMCYGDEKRGSLTEYARGFGSCLIALQNGLYDAQKAAEPEPRQSPYDTPLMPAIEAFHKIKPLAGNDPIDWPEHFLATVTSAMSAALDAYNPKASAPALSEAEAAFALLVYRCSNFKLSNKEAWTNEEEDSKPLWPRLEELGLIISVGSYKWAPTQKLIDMLAASLTRASAATVAEPSNARNAVGACLHGVDVRKPCSACAAQQQAEPKRCEYCDGTGDVTRADGEWLGECTACKEQRAAPAVDERELLAQAYEECAGDGPYPTYAQLARMGRGSFTQCALRAIRRAAESRQQPNTAEAVLDYLKANAVPSFQVEVIFNPESASLYRKEIITVAFSSWDLLIEHIRTAAQQGVAR